MYAEVHFILISHMCHKWWHISQLWDTVTVYELWYVLHTFENCQNWTVLTWIRTIHWWSRLFKLMEIIIFYTITKIIMIVLYSCLIWPMYYQKNCSHYNWNNWNHKLVYELTWLIFHTIIQRFNAFICVIYIGKSWDVTHYFQILCYKKFYLFYALRYLRN